MVAHPDGTPRVMLVRSKRTGDWGIPKGTIEGQEAGADAAEREAFEEAGVRGSASSDPVGHFSYEKDTSDTRYDVAVHIILKNEVADHYPEEDVRERGCFALADAVDLVARPQVRSLLRTMLQNYRS